jgi:hypothetical protein
MCHIIKEIFPGIDILGKMAIMLLELCRKDVKDRIVDQCPPNRIDCGWIDEWSWNNMNRCLRTSYRCVSLIVQ